AHERLVRICFIDYDREMALVADRKNPETGEHEIRGVGRLSKVRGTDEAEFALVVSDPYQGLGLGTELVSRLLQVGRDENISRIFGDILPENIEMQRICEKLHFELTHNVKESLIRATTKL
ncbi:MAG: GNAT family N-acetyltransferase, partial [Isosphaeraceae bacterium]